MIEPAILLPYITASLLFSIVPGPSVAVVLANSLARGTRAGLATVLGIQIVMLAMVVVVALGLQLVMTLVSDAFHVIKLVGAAYLVWIGWRMFSSRGEMDVAAGERLPLGRYIWQGVVVNGSNPKTLLFLGAFLPQFVDLARPAFEQIMVLGLIVTAVATCTDSIYALVGGRARLLLTAARVRLLNRVSGIVIMVGGIWLATMRRA